MDRPVAAGLDLAKRMFQARGARAGGATVLHRQRRRGRRLACFARLQPRLIGMEDGKPRVKRGKTGAAHAEAICGDA